MHVPSNAPTHLNNWPSSSGTSPTTSAKAAPLHAVGSKPPAAAAKSRERVARLLPGLAWSRGASVAVVAAVWAFRILLPATSSFEVFASFCSQKLQSSQIFVCLFMDGVLNLAGQKTGFDDAQDDQVIPAGLGKGVIHISIQQRNARKSITKVQGINPAVDLEKVLKALKKVMHAFSLKFWSL
jgi:hypothetical protein